MKTNELREQQRIISELLANAIYLKVPNVNVDSNGSINTMGDFDRTLFLWYDEQNHARAINQKNAMANYIESNQPYRFSSGGLSLIKPHRSETPYEALERFKEKFSEGRVPIEMAQCAADAFDPNEWVVQRGYRIDIKPQEFEHIHLSQIGILVELTENSFERYHEHIRRVRKDILAYWGERVLHSEMIEFADKHPELWNNWNEFFVDDGRDEYIDANGRKAPQELLQECEDEELEDYGYKHYVPVDSTNKVVCEINHSTILREDIERLHQGKKLEFLLNQEVRRK